MRLLHTSDWHLGTQIEKASCEKEQRAFLRWLLGEMEERATELLVVAGDVFHYGSPSNTAERMYYDFLLECTRLEALRRVVVVGGNHDSPTGLEAPRNVLEALDVTVIGDLPRDRDERAERCLHPIDDGNGHVEAVVAAVPYVRNSRLGLTIRGLSPAEAHQRRVESFDELYADLAERVRSTWPDVPLIATGHLTAYASADDYRDEDFETDIHASSSEPVVEEIGTVDALPPDVFSPYDYAALGHIHRRISVGSSHVHYSGSPVPTRLEEAESSRYVLDVRWNGDDRKPDSVESVEVPKWRQIQKIDGWPEDVYQRLRTLDGDDDLAPYLYLDVSLGEDETPQEPLERAREIIDETFDGETSPRIVDYSFSDATCDEDPWRDDEEPDLQELDPEEVFRRKYAQARGRDAEPREELMQGFRQLVSEVRDDDREDT